MEKLTQHVCHNDEVVDVMVVELIDLLLDLLVYVWGCTDEFVMMAALNDVAE